MKHYPTRVRIRQLASVVSGIERKQEKKPGYLQDILESLVNGELRRLEREQERFDRQEASR